MRLSQTITARMADGVYFAQCIEDGVYKTDIALPTLSQSFTLTA